MTTHPSDPPTTLPAIQQCVVATIRQGVLWLGGDEDGHVRFQILFEDARVDGYVILRPDWCKHLGARPGTMPMIDHIDIPSLDFQASAPATMEHWLGSAYRALQVRLAPERVLVRSRRGGWGFSPLMSPPEPVSLRPGASTASAGPCAKPVSSKAPLVGNGPDE